MNLSENVEFGVLGVGAIIESEIEGVSHILIQNRIRVDDATQNHLIEVPCGKVRSQQNIFETLRHRVKEETGLVVTQIEGQGGIYEEHPAYVIQSGVPFCVCQNVEKSFPVCILFFICKADAGMKLINSEAATDIRWITLNDLKQKLDNEESLFFPFVLEALKKYIVYRNI